MAQSPIGSAYLPGYRVGASKTNPTSSSLHHGSQGEVKSSSVTKNNRSKLKNMRSKQHHGVKKGLAVGVAAAGHSKETNDAAALSNSQLNNGNDLDANLSNETNGGGLQADILKDSSQQDLNNGMHYSI